MEAHQIFGFKAPEAPVAVIGFGLMAAQSH